MKKRMICLFITALILLSEANVSVFAAEQRYIGPCTYAKVVTYINNYPIPSYYINGYTFVVAEDLVNYGFDVVWNESDYSITISRNDSTTVKPIPTYRSYSTLLGTKRFDAYISYAKAYISIYGMKYEIECLSGIQGKSLINVSNLDVFGSMWYDGDKEAVMLWVNNLHVTEYKYIEKEKDPYMYVDDSILNLIGQNRVYIESLFGATTGFYLNGTPEFVYNGTSIKFGYDIVIPSDNNKYFLPSSSKCNTLVMNLNSLVVNGNRENYSMLDIERVFLTDLWTYGTNRNILYGIYKGYTISVELDSNGNIKDNLIKISK